MGHWQNVYGQREPAQLSWFEPVPETSLAWIAKANLPADATILDAGGGASRLAGELVGRGYSDITVADISTSAIERAKSEQPGGHLVVATFAPEGPTECSDLPVQRYSAEQLSGLLADDFHLLGSQLTDHHTPSGSRQQFVYAHFRRDEKSRS